MTNLTRWNPYREMANFRRTMNRFLEDPFLAQTWETDETMAWDVPVDVMENPDEYVVKASLPGIHPDDLEITYNNNTLTIHGEMKSEEERGDKESQYHIRERRFGSFTRSIYLPNPIQADKIKADYDAGVLVLHLPKTEEVKPKRIPVQVTGGRKTIEGSSKAQKQTR